MYKNLIAMLLSLFYDAGVGKKPAYYGVRSALRHRIIEKDTAIKELSPVNWLRRAKGSQLSPVNSQLSPVNSSWYTLDGRRLKGKPKMQGFFIQGGIKYLFR